MELAKSPDFERLKDVDMSADKANVVLMFVGPAIDVVIGTAVVFGATSVISGKERGPEGVELLRFACVGTGREGGVSAERPIMRDRFVELTLEEKETTSAVELKICCATTGSSATPASRMASKKMFSTMSTRQVNVCCMAQTVLSISFIVFCAEGLPSGNLKQ